MSLWGVITLESDTSECEIFVDRENELKLLRKYYLDCVERGVNCAILIYGWRRVGKTALIRRFLDETNGLWINCSWISDPRTFLVHVMNIIREKYGNKIMENYAGIFEEEDKTLMLRRTLELLTKLSHRQDRKLVIVLDEFHLLIEKLAYRIARETRKRKEIVESDILWLLREFLESKDVFWILTTSMGWAKIHEIFFSEAKKEKPLSGVVIRMQIEPLVREHSIELAMKLNSGLSEEQAGIIHELSGGVPRIIEILAPSIEPGENPIIRALELTRQGQFDEFFENIIKFIAEVSKRDYTVFVEVLKSMTMRGNTPEAIARGLNMDRVLIYNILEDLRKMDILEKEKVKGRVFYRLKYPLLRAWLELRIEPTKSIVNILASQLGITAESYIRELFEEYLKKGKVLELYDDDRGTFLAGTTKEIKLRIKHVYTREEIIRRLEGYRNADLIVIDENNEELLIEVKATIRPITMKDVKELAEKYRQLGFKKAILIQIGIGGIEISAVAEAVRHGIVIITREGTKLLAKKIGMPKY